ncbi:hypothetical protein AQI95_28905 [Streptomyces yokosukanensis]|uniref:Uncharacterized protein n=2 Tax=Streptomyces yokosukanensis TaxID=67386 RepID=A0A101NZD5_9ACTN|nr:hypothetical protein AQI95_28905 [Streptomyces yokosukanensis]
MLVLLWGTAHFVADLELAYPLTRRSRLRAAAERGRPLLDFTGAALAVRNAADRAWHAAHACEKDNHRAALADLALALTALEEALPLVERLGLPDATDAATCLHTELRALAAGCVLPALQSGNDRLAAPESIGSCLDVLLDLTGQVQAIGA